MSHNSFKQHKPFAQINIYILVKCKSNINTPKKRNEKYKSISRVIFSYMQHMHLYGSVSKMELKYLYKQIVQPA
jgi:hypothetical protein